MTTQYTGTDIIAALQAWWLATLPVQTSDGQLHHKSAPEDTQLPYLTYFLVAEVPEVLTTGPAMYRSTVQFNCHADTDTAARALGLAMRAALKAQPPLVIGVQTYDQILPNGDGIDIGEGLGPQGRDCWVATEVFDALWTM